MQEDEDFEVETCLASAKASNQPSSQQNRLLNFQMLSDKKEQPSSSNHSIYPSKPPMPVNYRDLLDFNQQPITSNRSDFSNLSDKNMLRSSHNNNNGNESNSCLSGSKKQMIFEYQSYK